MDLFECKQCGELRLNRERMRVHVVHCAFNRDLLFEEGFSLRQHANIHDIVERDEIQNYSTQMNYLMGRLEAFEAELASRRE